MIVIDKICYNSKLRYVNTRLKLIFTILTLIICIISKSFYVSSIVFIVNSVLNLYWAKISLYQYVKLILLPVAFIILSTLAIVIDVTPSPAENYYLYLLNLYFSININSVLYGLQIFATAISSVTCLYFLTLNTTMTDLLNELYALKCPVIVCELMMLIYRFIFVLTESADNINVAQISRLGNKNFIISCKSFAMLVSVVFIKSIKKSNILFDAMESRCYDGRINVITVENELNKKYLLLIIVFEILLVLITLLGA